MSRYSDDYLVYLKAKQAVLSINPKAKFDDNQTQQTTSMLAVYVLGYGDGSIDTENKAEFLAKEAALAKKLFNTDRINNEKK